MKKLLPILALLVAGVGIWWGFRTPLPQWLGGRGKHSTNSTTPATAEQELQQRTQQASEIQQLKRARDSRRMNDLFTLQTALESYRHEHEDAYPPALQELAPRYVGTIPADPGTGAQYQYSTSAGTVAYTITYTLEYGVDNLTAGQHTAVPGNVASR